MKKLLLLLVLTIGITTYAQDKTTKPTPNSKSFFWKDGNDKIVPVKYNHNTKHKFPTRKYNILITNIMIRTKYKCDNFSSYEPIELTLSETKSGIFWTVQSKYKYTNDNGKVVEATAHYVITEHYTLMDYKYD